MSSLSAEKSDIEQLRTFFMPSLLNWFDENQRDLPWRQTRDPYKIWVSEILLQQTRVKQALGYYQRFIAAFPNVTALANAEEEELLRIWQGLGYYSRARNLHSTAKNLMENYSGKLPSNFEELHQLKGIGRYTAAAIASNAFGIPKASVDGNVYRVLARLLAIDQDINQGKVQNFFFEIGDKILPKNQAGKANQALMEFGATHCTLHNPPCMLCFAQSICKGFIVGIQTQLPVKIKKLKIRRRFFYYLVFENAGKLLVFRRQKSDIWQGLYDFFLIETEKKAAAIKIKKALYDWLDAKDVLEFRQVSKPVEYKLTHQSIQIVFFRVQLTKSGFQMIKEMKALHAVSLEEFVDVPKPVPIVRFLEMYFSA